MKNIIRIFLNDLKSIGKNLIVFIVIIGISILPALYAWFNIAANWDPYSSTNGLSFAVCSLDKGYKYSAIKINAGDQIVSNLKQNDKMGWTFVSEKEAKEGVENGTYYAAVIIPKDFSECLFSLTTGKFEQAKLQYYVNEKKNAIAPKITDKGIQTIEESVNATYVSTITKIIATTLNLTTGTVDSGKDVALEKVVQTMDKTKEKIDNFKSTIDTLLKSLDEVEKSVDENKEIVPELQKRLQTVSNSTQNTKNVIAGTRNMAMQVTISIESVIQSAQNFSDDILEKSYDAISRIDVESETKASADRFRKITTSNDKIISVYERVVTILTTIQTDLDIDCSTSINRLNQAIQRQEDIKSYLNNAADAIEKTGKLPSEIQSRLEELLEQSRGDSTGVSSAFSGIRSRIDQSVARSYAAIDSVYESLNNLSNKVPELNKTFDKATASVASIKKTLENTKTTLTSVQEKLERYSKLIETLGDNTSVQSIIEPIIENPEALGEFVSSPVTIQSHSMFPVENYGSGMAPFYTTLGFWVGGVILVAVMKTDLTRHEMSRLKKPNTTQIFFGRYLIYFLIGQIQAWIIALGDLFFLKVQCESPVLFIIACLISSFVYTLIIYSLTITFSVIGKALAVIILVIQIAGSGGTFPIEVLPGPFQTISPYLPFKYGINAIRETVAGVDINAYWQNIGLLLAFVPFALILGIILRKPCIRVITFFNERVEQSDIVV